jgi:hypothetical protein
VLGAFSWCLPETPRRFFKTRPRFGSNAAVFLKNAEMLVIMASEDVGGKAFFVVVVKFLF